MGYLLSQSKLALGFVLVFSMAGFIGARYYSMFDHPEMPAIAPTDTVYDDGVAVAQPFRTKVKNKVENENIIVFIFNAYDLNFFRIFL